MDTNNSHPSQDEVQRVLSWAPHLTFYVGLISAALKDVAVTCNQSDVELQLDLREIEGRCSTEGLSFLTRTLPSLGKALDRALATDMRLETVGFKLAKGTQLPRFMRDVWKLVFDDDGSQRSDASAQAIKCLRQVFYLYYKLNIPPTEKQKNETIQTFLETDASLDFNHKEADPGERAVLRVARSLISRVLGSVDPLDPLGFQPRHGPGAVATGEKANEKAVFKRYYRSLDRVFPYCHYFYYNLTHLCDCLDQLKSLEDMETGTAKVVLVPKDSRGPRLISCEPLEYQWIQQGLMRLMVKTIEEHPLTRGYVNFTSQEVNRTLALEASLSGTRVTLDMKEASDRVSLELVKALFPSTWYEALFASRTSATELPDGRVVPLKKFAPMGSAVCFPVEALVFWALSLASITYYLHGGRWPRKEVLQSVYVYGDDIICDTKDHEYLLRFLPRLGLLFNESKCCVGRFFRESCGVDAFRGFDVTPLKVRATWSSSLADMSYVSWVAYHNALNERGFFHACDYLAEAIQSIRLTPYADLKGSGVVALVDCRKMAIQANRSKFRTRTERYVKRPDDVNYQVYEVKAWVVRARVKVDTSIPGWSEMQRVASFSGCPQGYQGSIRSAKSESALPPSFWEVGNRLAPAKPLTPEDAMRIALECDDVAVTAYQYTLPRQVTLRRGWGELVILRR
jgi:hypothetical protein